MILNFENSNDIIKARVWLDNQIENKNRVELKTKHKKRTRNQNSYLHLILSWVAIEMGETLEYIKTEYFKEIINYEIFKYERTNPKTGEKRNCLRSSADLDTKQMTIAIERFRNHFSQHGIYIPSANEKGFLDHIEQQIEQYKHYL